MEIRLKFPSGNTELFDTIEYNPVNTPLDAYIMKIQTWGISYGGKTYHTAHGCFKTWTNNGEGAIFEITLEEDDSW